MTGWAASVLFLACSSQPKPAAAVEFACSPTEDSLGHGLRTATADWLNHDFCEFMEETDTVDDLMDSCEGFCGGDNVPFLVGLPSVGFSLQDMDRMCINPDGAHDFVKYDGALMADCKQWASSLDTIMLRTADFVAAAENTTYAQLQFRIGMAEKVQELIKTIASEATTRYIMKSPGVSQLLARLVEILQPHFAEFFSDGRLSRDLLATISVLRETGVGLQQALKAHLPNVKSYLAECDALLLALTDTQQYLLDLCNQLTTNCLDGESDQARHVGCCCGAVPITGSFGIPGGSSPRRLQQLESAPINICGEAYVRVRPDMDRRRSALAESAAGLELLRAHEQGLKELYPRFYEEQCDDRRLAGLAEPGGSDAAATPPRPRHLQQRLKTCEPNSTAFDGRTLKAAFWRDTERELCGEMMNTSDMGDVCQAFCGTNAVPLLIGSTSFGFNQSAMNSVCLESSLLRTDERAVRECHDRAMAMSAVEVKAAALVSKLRILEAEKLLLQAKLKNAVVELRASIKAKAKRVLSDAPTGQKIDALQQLLKEETEQIGAAAKRSLQAATQEVQTAGQELEVELDKALGRFEGLMEKCNTVFTGVGPSGEYLLDVCSQTSTVCMDEEDGRHGGCCCGYLPMLAVGWQSIPTHTIPGLSDAAMLGGSRARVAANRRLSERPRYHICAAGWTSSTPQVDAAEREVQRLGYGNMVDAAHAALDSKYEGYRCIQNVTSTTQVDGARQPPARGSALCAVAVVALPALFLA